ncbi:protein of unknown function [Clostridium cavendishii DSM 21758]|uniref:DUF1877 domain-containing protein n=1 Tax=Clostridium cavendishii DSM 21758 TaxID=1121302 RepID=A0A1M6UWI4_9CLOT|nr:YfbM family protein [Clostridium cavendishii]SHK73446.1 protein of unknown function [Clostridium cavendishii DSM 21758]
MSMICDYLKVDKKTLNEFRNLDIDEIIEEIENLSENDEDIYSVDKLWDGLHFLLVGSSATDRIEDNPLSQAIMGVKTFSPSDEDGYIAYIESKDLDSIVKALKDVNIEELKNRFNIEEFRNNEIYPDIWREDEKLELFEELANEYKNIIEFYESALENKQQIVVSIY